MNQALQEAIAGRPEMVSLGGKTYPLAFPMQAVILYKSETARLDRERSKGRPRLTVEEKRSLRARRQKLLADAELLRPAKNEDWQPERFLECDALNDEATALKIVLDEDAATGDSLYNMYNWRKISADADPERLLLALWAGLHEFVPSLIPGKPDQYVETFTRQQLGGLLVNLGNGGDLTMAISKALTAHLIAPARVEEIPMEIMGSSPDDPPEPEAVADSRGDFFPNPAAEILPHRPQGIEERRAQRRPPGSRNLQR